MPAIGTITEFGKILYQAENTPVPSLRRLSNLRGNLPVVIDIRKASVKVARYHPGQSSLIHSSIASKMPSNMNESPFL